MLNKNVFKSLSAILIICVTAACVTQTALAAPDCPKLSGWNSVRLTVAQYQLGLNKIKPICVDLDKSYNIRIVVPGSSDHKVDAGDVTVEQKSGSPFIISGDNSDDAKYLKITVKNYDADAGDEVDCGDGSDDVCAGFWIKVKGVGELDPRVRVVNSKVAMVNLQDTLAEVLDDLGLTAEEATKLLAEPHDGK